VNLRSYRNPETDAPHIYDHGVSEEEVEDVLVRRFAEIRAGRGGSYSALGPTTSGRFLRVIFRREEDRDTLFVITAFEPGPTAIQGYRRRRRKKQ
jgi:hypothetical protein